VHKRIISAVKKVQFDIDKMAYIILSGCWRHIIVLNVHAPKRIRASTRNANVYLINSVNTT
jgi:hypothetical protein